MKDFFEGKTVVVYGATGGLGEAICKELCGRTQKLILAGRSSAKLEALKESLQGSEGYELEVWQVSGSNLEQNFAQSCRDAAVDGLIIATGRTVYKPFCAPDWRDYEQLLEVNLNSVLHLALELLPYFEDKNGFFHIAGSYACIFPIPYQAVYSASKVALLSFVQAVGCEYPKSLLSISLIGGMATGMYYQSDLHRQFSALRSLEPLFIAAPNKVAVALLGGIARQKRIITIRSSGWWIYHIFRRLPNNWLLRGLDKAYRPKNNR